MRKIFFLSVTLIALFLSNPCYSQSKYGNATIDELNMTVYPNDTTAAAVILLKEGETRFKYDAKTWFQYETTMKVKIKILKDDGLDYSNINIDYVDINRDRREYISGLSGTTYNLEDGQITKTKLAKEYIFDENVDGKYKRKKFTLPGVKAGSVIEYKYTITSDFLSDLRDFDFQEYIPVVYASYEIKIPQYYTYNVNTRGYESVQTDRKPENESFNVDYRDNSGRMRSERVNCSAEKYIFKGENIPAMKREPYLWALHDYKTKITFELRSTQFPFATSRNFTTTWDQTDEFLLKSESFGDNLKKTGLFKKEIDKMDANLESADVILNMIKNKVKWNDRSSLAPSNLNEALKTGLGSNADINFLLINALKAADFEAYPVILSTRSNGLILMTHPSIDKFNYVITGVKIGTLMYFTDASAKYGTWNILPSKCMVSQARIVKQDGSEWVDLTKMAPVKIVKTIQYDFSDSQATCKVADLRKDYAAYTFRDSYSEYKDQDEYHEKLASRLNGEIDDLEITGIDDINSDIKINYTLKKDIYLGNDYIYIDPLMEKYLDENPFKEETRKYPVNFNYPINYLTVTNITIPEGYAIEEIPKSEKFVTDNNEIVFTYRIGVVENKITLQYNYTLNKILFLQDEYDTLRNFFTNLVAKNAEQIVLKKVE